MSRIDARIDATLTTSVTINIVKDVVSLSISCADPYMAQVLYDDFVSRIGSKEGLILAFKDFKGE